MGTTEPSASVNLEYLSTSLQVRRTEGHEPTFSLDPVDADDPHSMQAADEGQRYERSGFVHGIYCGVQFGLDKFSLSTSVARQASVQAGLSQHRLAFGLSRRAGLAPASYIQSMA